MFYNRKVAVEVAVEVNMRGFTTKRRRWKRDATKRGAMRVERQEGRNCRNSPFYSLGEPLMWRRRPTIVICPQRKQRYCTCHVRPVIYLWGCSVQSPDGLTPSGGMSYSHPTFMGHIFEGTVWKSWTLSGTERYGPCIHLERPGRGGRWAYLYADFKHAQPRVEVGSGWSDA